MSCRSIRKRAVKSHTLQPVLKKITNPQDNFPTYTHLIDLVYKDGVVNQVKSLGKIFKNYCACIATLFSTFMEVMDQVNEIVVC